MDWRSPPRTEAEFCLWRTFAATSENEVWQYIYRWVKQYGNPFEDEFNEDFNELNNRDYFRRALSCTWRRK